MPTSGSPLLRLGDVADRLGVSVRTVRRLIADHELIATDVGTGALPQWRVSDAQVREFIERRSQ